VSTGDREPVFQWTAMKLRAVTVLVATLAGAGAPVLAAGPAAAAPRQVCRIGDHRLTEISGLAATRTGYVVVDDGSDDAAHRRIFFLNARCAVARTVSYPSRPRDTEDLALAPDGTLWVADIGDNGLSRTTIALWRLAPGGRAPRLYRLTYPDGPHDAETLLLAPDGTPIVVTKSLAAATLYTPDGPLRAGQVTPLRRAGAARVPVTGTSNPFGLPGRLVVTGGAVSTDGRHAVLRTYADAFEYDVPGGDVVRAVTDGTPRVVPLPDEPQGESVAYSPDGTALLTVSEVTDSRPASVLRYPLPRRPPATSPAVTPSAKAEPPPEAPDRPPAGALVAGGLLALAAAALIVATAWRRLNAR
jgi:hypothetical protein